MKPQQAKDSTMAIILLDSFSNLKPKAGGYIMADIKAPLLV